MTAWSRGGMNSDLAARPARRSRSIERQLSRVPPWGGSRNHTNHQCRDPVSRGELRRRFPLRVPETYVHEPTARRRIDIERLALLAIWDFCQRAHEVLRREGLDSELARK